MPIANRCAIRLRCIATVMPNSRAASSSIMKMPSRLNGARSLKSTNAMIRGSRIPVPASSTKAHANQSLTPIGIAGGCVGAWLRARQRPGPGAVSDIQAIVAALDGRSLTMPMPGFSPGSNQCRTRYRRDHRTTEAHRRPRLA